MKLKAIFPYVAAFLIVAICFGAIEASSYFLPDYKNTLEEIDINTDSQFFLLTDDNSTLFPWDLYENTQDGMTFVTPVTSEENEANKELIAALIYTLSSISFDLPPDVNIKRINCQAYGYEYINFIKDLHLFDVTKTEYVINIAYSDYEVFYYNCQPVNKKTTDSESIKEGYEILKQQFNEFREVYVHDTYDDETVYDDGDYDKDTCFLRFISRVEYASVFLEKLLIDADIVDLLIAGETSGVNYNNGEMSMTFSNSTTSLTVIYDLTIFDISGFSYKNKSEKYFL